MPRKSNTKRANGSGTIRKRKDGTWEARYTARIDTGSGKQIQRSIYSKSHDDIRKKLVEVSSQIDTGIYIDPVKLTVRQWADLWLKEYVGAVKKTTIEQYLYQIEEHIKPAIGAVRLTAVTAPMIQKMYNDVMKPHTAMRRVSGGKKEKKDVPGISAKSIKNLHGVCHRMFAKAVLLHYIHANPCDACELPRVEKKEMHPISGDYFGAFLAEIKNDEFGDLFFVDVFTGMRQGEILGLTWDCVDFIAGTITIKQQLQQIRKRGEASTYEFTSPKTGKTRVIQPAPSVMKVLKKIHTQQNEYKMASGQTWENEDNLVFVNAKGGHLIDNTVLKHLKMIVTKIGIPETRFHDLRHTYATNAIRIGDPIKTVSENLGHATVAFTLDVYGHVTPQMKQDSAERMQRLIDACG